MPSSIQSLVFFADGSQETHTALSELLLSQQTDSLLSLYLSRVKTTLQDEYTGLPQVLRNEMPNFYDLEVLTGHSKDDLRLHPALHPVQLVLVQLAQFISAYESRPHEPYPTSEHNIVVGICFGELSATAVSLARSLTELIPLAVEIVRLAFKAGVASNLIGDELEVERSRGEPWSFSVSTDTGLADDNRLEEIRHELGILGRKRPYVTFISQKSVTIGGPPSSLRRLISHLANTSQSFQRSARLPVNVFSPCHAAHLYSYKNILKIICETPSCHKLFHEEALFNNGRTFIGGTGGVFHKASSPRDLLSHALYNILARPVNWEHVLEGCNLYLKKDFHWIVRPFGPTLMARNLAHSCAKTSDTRLMFDGSFGSGPSQLSRSRNLPIAIIGMAGRFPNASSPDTLWELLLSGVECVREIPKERFDSITHLKKASYGCFIEKPGMFDAAFFNMSPREALQTDPGQRLALVTAYEALEMAGYVPSRTTATNPERIGTFYGQVSDEYKEQNMTQNIDTYFITGSMRAFGPGRVNRYFKFGGPALNVDTACSSSLVAMHLAYNSIQSGECDTAVVIGVNIISSSNNYIGLKAGHFLSPTGGCKTFDDTADGYCRGEAVGSLVLKKLDAARSDNDNILGTILSIGTNYSAHSVSITYPHGPTQEGLYRRLLAEAGLSPLDITYVQLHGTGTQAGDTEEIRSISNVFARSKKPRLPDNPLFIGAVKANVGHGESASGITALINSLLIMGAQKLPPHVGIKSTINHKFPDLTKRNVRIPLSVTDYPSLLSRGKKRRMLVNNFNAAGGNSACIIEEGPGRVSYNIMNDLRPHQVISVTAKSPFSLRRNIENLIVYLDKESSSSSISDLAYTTTVRRLQYPLRRCIVATDTIQLRSKLAEVSSKGIMLSREKKSGMNFVFSGQGTLYPSLGSKLFELSKQFRDDITRYDQISKEHGFPSFLSIVTGTPDDLNNMRPSQIQLATVAVQMALYRLYHSWGVSPDLVMGHSLGEYAAMYASKVLTASDTLYLVGTRALLLESQCCSNTHCMMAITAASSTLEKGLCAFESLEIACKNGPQDTVLAGPVDILEAAAKVYTIQGLRCNKLKLPYAFHSSQMDQILEVFEKAAESINYMEPKIPMFSTLLARKISGPGIINASYLKKHIRKPVDFYGALTQYRIENSTHDTGVWLELGPHPTCLSMIKTTLGVERITLPTLRKNENPWTTACNTLASIHELGHDILWREYHKDFESGQRLLKLPTYSFDEKDYWIEYKNHWLQGKRFAESTTEPSNEKGPETTTVQKLLTEIKSDNGVALVFETDLKDPAMQAVIVGHVLNGSGLCPASVYADIGLTVANYVRGKYKINVPFTGMNVIDMEISQPIILMKTRPKTCQLLRITVAADVVNGVMKLEYGDSVGEATARRASASCSVRFGEADKWLASWSRTAYVIQKRVEDLERGLLNGNTHKVLRGMAYKLFARLVQYDSKFQGMREILFNSEELEAVTTLDLHPEKDSGSFFYSPFWIDGFMHLSGFIMNVADISDASECVYICNGWKSMRIPESVDTNEAYRVHVKMFRASKTTVTGDASIFQRDKMVGLVEGISFQRVPRTYLNILIPPAAPTLESSLPAQEPEHRDPGTTRLSSTPLSKVDYGLQSLDCREDSLPFGATSSDAVICLIANEIGVSSSELSDDKDFAKLGVDSLLSLAILSKLREELHMDFPQTLFQEYATVCDLRKLIDSSESRLVTGLSNGGLPSSGQVEDSCLRLQSQKNNLAETCFKNQKPNQTLSFVLHGHPDTSSRFVFFFPDGSGSAASYNSISYSSPDVCVIAFNSPGVGGESEVSFSVESLVKTWVEVLKVRQARGPYILAGWSAGGFYAFEAARLLLATGDAVEKVIMIDSPPRNVYEAMSPDVLDFATQNGIAYSSSSEEPLLDHFKITLKAVDDYVPTPITDPRTPTAYLIWATDGALEGHPDVSLPTTDSFTKIIESKISQFLLYPKSEFGAHGWDRLFLPAGRTASFWIAKTPGNHFNMMQPPHSETLSDLIRDALLSEPPSETWKLWKAR